MMKLQTISFEYNCKEGESTFKQVDGHSYCNRCRTNIIDLKSKSKDEIREILIANNDALCGQFFLKQIRDDRPGRPKLNFKIALAAVTTLLTVAASKSFAQSTPKHKTEQHTSTSALGVFQYKGQSAGIDSTDFSKAPENHNQKAQSVPEKKNVFLRIGKRHFYTTKGFPFIGSSKLVRGRLKIS